MKLRTTVSLRRGALATAAVTAAVTATAGTIVTLAAGAGWAAYAPRAGDLCQAAENIQFYANDFETPSYVVQTNEYIRMDITGDTLVNWTMGHGDGHSSRSFKYRHGDDSSGQLRVKNCH